MESGTGRLRHPQIDDCYQQHDPEIKVLAAVGEAALPDRPALLIGLDVGVDPSDSGYRASPE